MTILGGHLPFTCFEIKSFKGKYIEDQVIATLMQILELVKVWHMFFTSVHKTKINAEKNCA